MTFKNIRPVALLAAVAALAAALYLVFSKDKNPCAAIPSEAAIVLEFNPIDTAGTSGLPHIRDYGLRLFVEKSDIQDVYQQAAQAQKWLEHDGPLRRAFQSGRMLAALTWRSEDKGCALFVLDLQETDAHLEQAVATLHDRANGSQMSEQQFRENKLWVFTEPDPDRHFVFAQKNNLLIFSASLALVEDALANHEAGDNWWSDCPYLRGPNLAVPFRAVLRGSVLAQRFGERLLPQHQDLPLMLLQHLDWLGLGWDGHALRAEWALKGMPNHRTAWNRTQLGDLYGVLPSNTAFAVRLGLPTSWPVLKKMDHPPSPDFEAFIGPWWGREVAFVVTEPVSNSLSGHAFWMLESRDTARASALLDAYGEQHGLLKKYDYQTFVIRQLLGNGLLQPFVEAGSAFQNPACAVVGGHVVFASSPVSLERWIDQYIVGETLTSNTDFLQMAQSLPAESGAALLFNSASLPALARSLCRPDWMLKNVSSAEAFAPTGWVGASTQLSGSGGPLRLDIARGPTAAAGAGSKTGLVWKTPLTAEAALSPQVVSTPAEEGGASILVQDVRHQLYCLNQNGQLRWRRQLPGPILSEVQGIDFFNNQTRCYFFNTPDALWVLDGNGHDVKGFPLQLRSPATNGAVAVAFGSHNEHGFFVALENGNVQGFNAFGQPLEGWNPQPIGGQVTVPLLHFQHAGKDYLAVLTRSGRLSVFGKNGQPRFAPVQLEGQFGKEQMANGGTWQVSEGAMQVNLRAGIPYIVCFNARGGAFACNTEGDFFSLRLSPDEGAGAKSGFLPLGNNSLFEYAVAAGSTLTYGHFEDGQYRQIFSKKNEGLADVVFVPQSGLVGLLRRQRRQVLLHAAGTVRSFEGSTAFRMLKMTGGGSVLVVGNGASVCGYGVE